MVNQVVANNWTVLLKGTLVRGVSGVETVWYVHFLSVLSRLYVIIDLNLVAPSS
jgi:hypothetical protein